MGLGKIPCTLLNDRLVLGTVLEDLLLDGVQFFDTDQQLALHGPDLWLERMDQTLDIGCGDAFFLVKDKPALLLLSPVHQLSGEGGIKARDAHDLVRGDVCGGLDTK